jgi:DNA-binding transcriptional regulator GbsR (MarR family)
METARKEFEDIVHQGMKSYGLDDLSSKLLSVLYSEPDPITLEELSTRTGYSFSAVSAAMKLLSGLTLVEKTKKAGSKKLYFSIQKDMLEMTINAAKTKKEVILNPALQGLPLIIEKCKKNKTGDSETMLKLIEDYYQQMVALDLIIKNLIEFTEKIQKEMGKEWV